MVHCVAFGCSNDKAKKGKNAAERITFHRFPKNPEQRAKWIKAVKRKGWEPNSSSVLCSVHFKEEVIDRTSLSVVRLRENAVPEIFPGHPRRMQPHKNKPVNQELVKDASGPSAALDAKCSTKTIIDVRQELKRLRDCNHNAFSSSSLLQEDRSSSDDSDSMEFLNGMNDSDSMESSEPIQIGLPSCTAPKRKKKKSSHPLLQFLERSAEARQVRRQEWLEIFSSREQHPIDVFFQAMSKATKRLPQKHQIQVKSAVFRVVQEAEKVMLRKKKRAL